MQEPRHAEHEEDTEQNDEREQTALLRRQMRTSRLPVGSSANITVGFETSARLVAWAYPTTKLTSLRGTTIVFWIAWRSMCA